MSLTVSKNQIWSLFVLVSCLNIESVTHFFPASVKLLFGLRLVLLFFLVVLDLMNRRRPSGVMLLITLMCAFVIGTAFITKDNMMYVVRTLSTPFLIAYFIDGLRADSKKLLETVVLWRNILLLLLIADLGSMIVFRNGIYKHQYCAQKLQAYRSCTKDILPPAFDRSYVLSLVLYN